MRAIKSFIISIALTLTLITGASAEFFSDIIVTSPDGIWTDSRAYSSLTDAVNAIGSTKQRTIVISSQLPVGNITIPSNITLKFERDGAIINSGQLTLNTRNIIAENRQIFAGAGDIDFTSGTVLKSGWFSTFERAALVTADDSVTLIITKPQTLTTTVALGNNVVLKWDGSGNILTANTGVDIQNICNIEAGDFQLFAGAGDFDFTDGMNLKLSWFVRLRSAITYIETDKVTLNVTRPSTVDLTDTIPSNISLNISEGAPLTVSPGQVLTISGPLLSTGAYQQFVAVSGEVLFSDGVVESIKLEWFGGSANGTTDNISAYNVAIGTCNYPYIQLGKGIYYTTAPFCIKSHMTLAGLNKVQTRISSTQNNNIIQVGDGSAESKRWVIKDLLIHGNGSGALQVGLNLNGTSGASPVHDGLVDNVAIWNCGGKFIYANYAWVIRFTNCEIGNAPLVASKLLDMTVNCNHFYFDNTKFMYSSFPGFPITVVGIAHTFNHCEIEFNEASSGAITFGTTSDAAEGCRLLNSWIADNRYGSTIYIDHSNTSVSIKDNIITCPTGLEHRPDFLVNVHKGKSNIIEHNSFNSDPNIALISLGELQSNTFIAYNRKYSSSATDIDNPSYGKPILLYAFYDSSSADMSKFVAYDQIVSYDGFQSRRSDASSSSYSTRVTGDTYLRHAVLADGAMVWGPGSDATDTGLSRTSAGILTLAAGGAFVSDRFRLVILTAQPSTPTVGDIVMADRATWDPLNKGSGGPYLCWYDGSNWQPM